SQDQFNATLYDAAAVVIVSLQTFPGMWINAFIASVLFIAWVKKKSFNSNEKILLFLGCCRFWYLCFMWVYSIISIFYPWVFYVPHVPQLFASIKSFLNFCNLWVSACLCIFYCIKIANFRHIFFIYMKTKIDRIVPWLLLGSVLLSLVIGILVYIITSEALCNNHNSTIHGNIWKVTIKVNEHFFPVFFLAGFGFATTFIAAISSALLLLFSLWRHKRKMQTNSGKNISMDAHVKAMKSILYFFILYSINFTCLILTLIYATEKINPVAILISLFQYAFPGVHSLILIFNNPKLEKALQRTLSCVTNKVCMRQ
ncbi:TA2R8 protein, partial [Thinocorus orbignyianus]|nr:TA2R8 protein [Thinocorus orbignyianus]